MVQQKHNTSSDDIKNHYLSRREVLLRQHRKGKGGIKVSLALCSLTDSVVEQMFSLLPVEHQEHLSIVATGGYGRNELCFGSDIDILFLVDNDRTKKFVAGSVKSFLHQLLTLGVTVGHSYRTIAECISIAKHEIEPSMSLLEARFLCGNAFLFSKFQREMRVFIEKRNASAFVRRLLKATAERHQKYGSSSQLLEPNIKNSAGGLRDVHTALWLLYGTGFCPIPSGRKTNAIHELLSLPLMSHLVPKQSLFAVLEAYDFLLRVRNEMHLQTETLQDSLEFTLQRKVAQGIGFRDRGTMSAVEHAMHRYHLAVRTLEQFSKRLFEWAKIEWGIEKRSHRMLLLDDDFYIQSSALYARSKRIRLLPATLLRLFLYQCQHRVQLSFDLEDMVRRAALSLRPSLTAEECQLWRTLLNYPHGVAETLRSMSELGVLERWIPEWKKMRAFYQHNQYHIYTADEHTLRVLRYGEEIFSQPYRIGTVVLQLPRKDVLMLACLLHDIAKPVNLSKHEIEGKKMVAQILRRFEYEDVLNDVAFLVRYHLSMEQVAFRRNLDDYQTIESYAKLVGNRTKLHYLFALTHADLSAVNPTVLTSWKRTLLETLFVKTDRFFAGQQSPEDHAQRLREQYSRILEALSPRFGAEEVERHLTLLNSLDYLHAFSLEEIETHLSILRSEETTTVYAVQTNHWTEVTFIGNDAPFLLSHLCGVLTAHNANILDAQIFTRSDGKVIDRFRVVDVLTQAPISEETITQIRSDAQAVLQQTLGIDILVKENEKRWKRYKKPFNPTTKCDVVFSDHPQYTIIDVYGEDTFGLLYRITHTLSEEGCDIRCAKISTRLDGVVDSFYVIDAEGRKITDPEKLERLRQRLLAIVQTMG